MIQFGKAVRLEIDDGRGGALKMNAALVKMDFRAQPIDVSSGLDGWRTFISGRESVTLDFDLVRDPAAVVSGWDACAEYRVPEHLDWRALYPEALRCASRLTWWRLAWRWLVRLHRRLEAWPNAPRDLGVDLDGAAADRASCAE